MMLGDQGANVIKVERPEGGDTARGGAPKIKNDKGQTQSGYFLRFNRNKRSLTLNLKSDRGRQIFRELPRKSPVIAAHLPPAPPPHPPLPSNPLPPPPPPPISAPPPPPPTLPASSP